MSTFDAIERTALLTAALDAAETRRQDRLYADPYAAALAGDIGPGLLAEVRAVTFPAGERRTLPSTPDYHAIRTRFFDDYLVDAVRDPVMNQVVLVAAGMDARAFRLRWPRRIRLFEVDRPVVLSVKDEVLGSPGCAVDRRPVGADLRDADWTGRLLAEGYDPAAPSTWLLEGLLHHLRERDVHRILDRVRAMTAPDSLVAADVVNRAALHLPAMRGLLDLFAGWGCPWLSGTDEPEALFAGHGIDAVALQPGEPAADYGRWPDPVPPSEETGVRRMFFVHGPRTED